jgi:hypothetical protein
MAPFVLAVTMLASCGLDPLALPDGGKVFAEDLTPIISSGLSAQEKRDRLGELGLDPLTINGLLQSERTGNQFGGTLRTAYEKMSAPRFSDMTPDELQIYTDAARAAGAAGFSINLTDEQAQALRDLLVAERLNSSADVEAFVGDPGKEIPPVLPADALTQIFINLDPDTVLQQLP